MMDQSTIVVIPTYNERENLPRLVRAIVAMPGFSVMVVDDASPDGRATSPIGSPGT
jgi:glycosyltransferase involved in cell wall biosynthesis